MATERKLTPLGKLIILIFVAACFYGAYYLFFQRGSAPSPTPVATSAGQSAPAPAPPAAKPAPAPAAAPRNVLAEVQRRGSLRVAYEGDAPPMYYVTGNQPVRGFEFELARSLAGELGVASISFIAADYAELPALLREGKADLMLAGYIPDPSIDGVEWSNSYLDFGLCLIVLQSSAVTEPQHLAGKAVAIYDDPAAGRWVQENIPRARMQTFSGASGWFEALEARQVDGLVYDYPFAATEIKDHPRAKIVKFNLNRAHYAVGLPARNDALLDAVNAALGRILASPRYGELMREFMPYRSDSLTKAVAGAKNYTVREGDTLAKIAGKTLNAAERWPEIWELNRGRIPNPHLIYSGYVLILP
ncbi:MAG: hypothetical protein A2091_07215 [Desulfuromonadales bacterium GWD2_61_12]|nr:MAG: hypothetical protein A2091_07215 [Desulfuromonadales bacterium GWD2_61_12]